MAYAEALARPGLAGIQAGSPRPGGRFDNLVLVGNFDFAVGTFSKFDLPLRDFPQ